MTGTNKALNRIETKKLICDLADQGYRFVFSNEGECVVFTPKDDEYSISVTGQSYERGCSCLARGPCKHMTAFLGMRPCGECQGVMLREEMTTATRILTGSNDVFRCVECNDWILTSKIRPWLVGGWRYANT